MFDIIAGLPLHALVVHAVVVLLPLAAVATMAVALRPAWRVAALPIVILDAVMVVASLVAKESGEQLQARLSALAGGAAVAHDHGEQGDLVPVVALVLLGAALLVWLARRRPALVLPAGMVAVVVGLAVIAWTVVVGHSGATAVWGYVASGSGS